MTNDAVRRREPVRDRSDARPDDAAEAALLTRELGNAIRRARLRRGLTLRQVEVASRGRCKPSSIASYERGERRISVERLCALASFLRADAGRLVSEALGFAALRQRREVLVDVRDLTLVLDDLDESEADLLEERVLRRGAREGRDPRDLVALSAREVERLADDLGRSPPEFLSVIHAAIRDPSSADPATVRR